MTTEWSEQKAPQASTCFMCTKYAPRNCLECRTHRLLSDIRSGLYDQMGTEQNRAEWEERALKAEAELTQAKAEIERLKNPSEYICVFHETNACKECVDNFRKVEAELEQERERGRKLAEGIAKALDRGGTSDDAEKALAAYNSTPSGEAAQERSNE